jgi:predicted acetyltransferase
MLKQKSFDLERGLFQYGILSPKGETVGTAQLRLAPSRSPDMPKGFESHIYYEVGPEHRGQGYGGEALKDLITEAEKHGLNRLIATVNSDNLSSIKVIEKCGGKLLEEGKTKSGQAVLKYEFVRI